MKTSLARAVAAGSLLVWVGISAGWPGPRLRLWQRGMEQQWLLLRGARPAPPEVVTVAVDDATLQQGAWFQEENPVPSWARGMGTLPWPRASYGRLAEALLEAGAAAVAINVVFEGESSHGPADDEAMEAILRRHRGRVALAAEMLEPSQHDAGGLTLVRPERFMGALDGPTSLGLTNILASDPGTPTLHPQTYGGETLPAGGAPSFPALSSTLLRLAGRASRQRDAGSELNVYGPEATIRRIPAWQVLDPERWSRPGERSSLSGALVLVGTVVSQGDDGYPTAFGPLSGLEVLATATANSLAGDGLRPWPSTPLLRALAAILPVLLVVVIGARLRGTARRLLLDGVVLAALLALAHGAEGYLLEQGERRRLRHTFERYVAPGVVAEILADPEAAQGVLRGRLLPVTVLMADLRGFTPLTRQRSREGRTELHVRQLNTYLGAMVEVITAHGGTVDKFVGDAVMAVFGSPLSRGVHEEARAAVHCALAMRRALASLNASWEVEGIARLDNGVGLASGEGMVGQIGSPRRMEFTVIGDIVNRAARLESQTRHAEAAVLFDRATADLIRGDQDLVVRSLGPLEMKGLGAVEALTASTAAVDPRSRADG